jgi:hypothetical protein
VNDIHARIIAAKVVEDVTVGVRLQPGRVARFVVLESIHTHKSSLLLFLNGRQSGPVFLDAVAKKCLTQTPQSRAAAGEA